MNEGMKFAIQCDTTYEELMDRGRSLWVKHQQAIEELEDKEKHSSQERLSEMVFVLAELTWLEKLTDVLAEGETVADHFTPHMLQEFLNQVLKDRSIPVGMGVPEVSYRTEEN